MIRVYVGKWLIDIGAFIHDYNRRLGIRIIIAGLKVISKIRRD